MNFPPRFRFTINRAMMNTANASTVTEYNSQKKEINTGICMFFAIQHLVEKRRRLGVYVSEKVAFF